MISVTVAALATWAMNDLNNTPKFAKAQQLENAAANAMELGIQSIRYTPLIDTGETLSAYPPSYCWGSGPLSQLSTSVVNFGATQSVTMDVWCSTVTWNPTQSSPTREVDLYTCLSGVTSSACYANAFLKAVVDFDDYPAGQQSAPIQGPCSVFCGQGMTIQSWIWGASTNTSALSVASSATFTNEPSATTVGAVTSAAVTVEDSSGRPVVGDPVTVLINTGPSGGQLSGTVEVQTNPPVSPSLRISC